MKTLKGLCISIKDEGIGKKNVCFFGFWKVFDIVLYSKQAIVLD